MQRQIISEDGRVYNYTDQAMPKRGWKVGDPTLLPLAIFIPFIIAAKAAYRFCINRCRRHHS